MPPILNVNRGRFCPQILENGDERMILLEALQIKHHVQDRLLFDIERLVINKNDRIGLVGPNGSGKTTLLNILASNISTETGTVISHAQSELLPQLKLVDTIKSGGEITQAYINDAMAQAPELLLADELTTHLDREHIEWLEKKLNQWKGAFVVVSHDRAFLDALCTTIWEIRDGKVKEYKGNYTDYAEQKELERRQQELAYELYEKKKEQLEETLKLKKRKAERATKAPKKEKSIRSENHQGETIFREKTKEVAKSSESDREKTRKA